MKETKNGDMKLTKREWEYIFEKEKLLCEFIYEWVHCVENNCERVTLVDYTLQRLLKLMEEYKDTIFD